MAVASTHYTVVIPDADLALEAEGIVGKARPRRPSRVRIVRRQSLAGRVHPGIIYVVSRLPFESSSLRVARGGKSPTRHLLFPGDLPIQSVIDFLPRLRVRRSDRVHLTRLRPGKEGRFLRRFLASLDSDREREKIIDAWREGEAFVVKSPTFETLRIPLRDIPRISAAPKETVDRFEIDEYGDFVYWPDLNTHMGWPQFEQIVDPARRFRADQKSAEFNRRYGRAIRRLRERFNLAQSSVGGLDERTVRRIEQGLTRATANAIRKLAAAHGMKPGDYMAEVARLME